MISEFPLFLFTTCVGLSAGAYVAHAVFPLKKDRELPWLFHVVCVALLALGAVGVMFHLGRPALFMNAFANPTAGITKEAYALMCFGVLLVVDLIVTCAKGSSPRALSIVTGLAAVAMIVVMGIAYTGHLGVAAWSSWAVFPLFVAGGLAMGFALYALFNDGIYKNSAFFGITVAAEVVFAIAIIGEIMHFLGMGLDAMLFVAALIIGPGGATVLAFMSRKAGNANLPAAAFACALIGVCLARWAFYAAGSM